MQSAQACPVAPPPISHSYPGRTSAPTRLRAPVPVPTACRSTPRATPPHTGSDPLDSDGPSAYSAQSHSPAILPQVHGLPLVTILPVECAATSLVEPTGNTDRKSQ